MTDQDAAVDAQGERGPVARLRPWHATNGHSGTRLYVWCPGCDDLHAPEVVAPDGHTWDGNLDAPTVSPSILVTYGDSGRRCHSYLEGGRWRFLGDCTHDLAGETVPAVGEHLPPLYPQVESDR